MFGAYVFRFNGKVVSRDLIDSVLEINFLQENFGPRKLAVLDIGAGYGRLGHRLSEVMPSADPVFCTDGVAESTFICDFYLRYRKARARAIPVDEVESLVKDGGIDLATNIHSFSECTAQSISCGLRYSAMPWGRESYMSPTGMNTYYQQRPTASGCPVPICWLNSDIVCGSSAQNT